LIFVEMKTGVPVWSEIAGAFIVELTECQALPKLLACRLCMRAEAVISVAGAVHIPVVHPAFQVLSFDPNTWGAEI
jgi:hypothetical protein